ncbi:MAG: AAA family ATPase [Pirellulaceae bacterium]
MNMQQKLREYVRACFTGIWIQSHEHNDALMEIARLCNEESWQLATWNIGSGLQVSGATLDTIGGDPLSAVRTASSLSIEDGTVVLVLENFHRFLNSTEVVQAVARQIILGKQNRTILVVLAPVLQLPIELQKQFVVIEHELPDRNQLAEIAVGIATEELERPSGTQFDQLMDAASGLTRMEAENAFSLSLVRHGELQPDAVWELKTQALNKSGSLTLYRGTDSFESIGGLSSLKAFCKRVLLNTSRDNSRNRPRGVLLLSPPGCGKSQFCKALGSEVGRPVLILDVGSLMGSLVGQSEERTREALRTIDAMAPCVLMIDEVEKAFSGVNGSGDSGVSTRMFGTFLSWLNDHESDVFVVCTANDVSRLPPEFGRSERFDGIFFLDLPERDEKEAIWNIYLEQFDIDRSQRRPDDANWTGAEIKACCRLSSLLDLPLVQAAQNVVPIATTAAESVERLRNWADGRCLSANQPGVFRKQHTQPTRRRVSNAPSKN